MSDGIPLESVIVSDRKFSSDDPEDIVVSNIAFLNAHFEEYLTEDEVSPDGLRSYYVHYFLGEVENGGFSQFVYDSQWEPRLIRLLREGLVAMGAVKYLAVFDEASGLVDRLGPDRLEEFLLGDYFGDNEERDILNEFNERFFELSDEEDLDALNASWLRGLPHLVVLTVDEMAEELLRRALAIPDRNERIAEALENEPRYVKLIRALCDAAGHVLDHVAAGDFDELNGEEVTAWHFLTDKGHHYMIEADGVAFMCHGETEERVCEIPATDEYGED